jgi:hypothetical protein
VKYEITQEDKQIVERDMKTDRVLKHLRNLSFYKFSVGDVLVRENRVHSNEDKEVWKIELGSGDIPHKYVYVFENELKVGYIRRLSVTGRKFVERPMCVTEFDPDYTRFKLDPEYADHMLLLGEEEVFDASLRYDTHKKRREALYRRNKKIAIQIPDVNAAIAWFKTLKIGDQIWWGYSINNVYKEPYFVEEINMHSAPMKFTLFGAQESTENIKISTRQNTSYSSYMYATSIPRYYVFAQRPQFLDEIVD